MTHAYPVGPPMQRVAAATAEPQSGRHRLGPRAGAGLRLVLFVVVALAFGRLHELIPGVSRLPVAKILIPTGYLALLSQAHLRQRLRVLRTKQGRMFGLLVFAMILSGPFSLYRSGTLHEFINFIKGTGSLVILVAVACADAKSLYGVARAVAVAGGVLGLALLGGGGSMVGGRAVAGSTYDPNDMALVGVVVFPLALWLLRDRSRLWRWAGAACAAGALGTVILSASRGGMLGLAVVVLLLAVRYRRSIPMAGKLLGVVMLVGALAAAPPEFWARVATFKDLSQDYNATGEVGRLALWRRGLGYFASRPLTGVGLGQFGSAEGNWATENFGSSSGFKWSVAHSVWIQILSEIGIFGIIGFVGLYLPTLKDIRRLNDPERTRGPPDSELASFGVALGIAIVGFFVCGTFLAAAYSPPAMMLAAMGMSYSFIVRQAHMVPSGPTEAPRRRGRRRGGAARGRGGLRTSR
jgi:hypothetical protein